MRASALGAGLLLFACAVPSEEDSGNLDLFRPLALPSPNAQRTAAGRPGPGYWQQQVDYRIEAALDPTVHRITGRAEVVYTNNSPDELSYLWIHLEQNIHRPDSLSRLSGLGAGLGSATPGLQVSFVRTSEGRLPMRVYDTVGRIDLPQPIAPGEVFRFSMGWSFYISPDSSLRMGVDPDPDTGPVYELAQWFPAVAVYDDVYGWNNLPYLGPGEFYTNFGDFDVSLTVPRDYLCAATGTLVNSEQVLTAEQHSRLEQALASDETVQIRSREEIGVPASRPQGRANLTWRYQAEQVRTFAWAASPVFAWDAAGVSLDRDTRVLVQSFYPTSSPEVWNESTQMLRHSLAHYSRMAVPYPWPQMTNVRGPVDGGMEYPMIVFCREAEADLDYWYGGGVDSTDPIVLFDVLDHEVGHSWFPMIVNTDERRHAWMDEGFNTFINIYSQRAYLGQESYWLQKGFFFEYEDPGNPGVIADRVDHISRVSDSTHLAYTRPARGLYLLREHILGPRRFDDAFDEYLATWAFHSPQPADFFRIMEDVSGADLTWFWRGWFLENRQLDQTVVEVEWSARTEEARVTFGNRGDMVMPLIFRVHYENGSVESRRLPVEAFYADDQMSLRWPSASRVVRIEIDPSGEFPDWDRSNNVWER